MGQPNPYLSTFDSTWGQSGSPGTGLDDSGVPSYDNGSTTKKKPSSPSTPSGPATPTFIPVPGGKDQIVALPEEDPLTGDITYKYVLVPNTSANGGSGGGRNDALTAAMDALHSYLQASSLASARQKDAFDQFHTISQFALPPGATTAPGYEMGGPANAFAKAMGYKYTPPPINTVPINPQQMAQEPPMSPTVAAMLAAISGAGGNAAAQAAATGGQ